LAGRDSLRRAVPNPPSASLLASLAYSTTHARGATSTPTDNQSGWQAFPGDGRGGRQASTLQQAFPGSPQAMNTSSSSLSSSSKTRC